MAKRFSEVYSLTEKKQEPTGDLKNACWDGYVAVGMKKKNGKMVPNCVPENSEEAKAYMKKEALSAKQKKIDLNKNGKIDGNDLKKLRKEEKDMSDMCCKHCGDNFGEPKSESCMYDAYDAMGENWCKKDEYKGNMKEAKDPNEYDKEGDMAKTQLRTMIRSAEELMNMMGDDDNLPEWVQSKITKATDYMRTVSDYMQSSVNEEMTDAQYDERERIVKGMKKSFKDFVGKYGSEKKAKEVMYATATKMAMKKK